MAQNKIPDQWFQGAVVWVLIQECVTPLGNLIYLNGSEPSKFGEISKPKVVNFGHICSIKSARSICQCPSSQPCKALVDIPVGAEHEQTPLHEAVRNWQPCLDLITHVKYLGNFPARSLEVKKQLNL